MKKFLALGDSYTIGEAVLNNDRWPNQLCKALLKEDIILSDPVIIAKTGWTTDELLAEIQNIYPDSPGGFVNKDQIPVYDIVSLLIGVNNQYRKLSIDTYRNEFRTLLKLAIIFANNIESRVFVLSIPDWGITPFAEGQDRGAIKEAIDMFNKTNKEETLKNNIQYIDITPISRLVDKDPSLLASDGLHPSGKMYEKWVELILPFAKKILEEKDIKMNNKL